MMIAACSDPENPQSASWRYKMIVEVDTPEGVKTGSAVREVSVKLPAFRIPDVSGVDVHVKGEAVTVDLGRRGVLFALMKDSFGPDYNYSIVFSAFHDPAGFTPGGLKRFRDLKNASAVLKPEQYPLMVAFHDLTDQKTVGLVYEQKPYDVRDKQKHNSRKYKLTNNFEKYFGKGVSIKSVSIEMTKEPVAWSIEQFIPWLPSRKNMMGAFG